MSAARGLAQGALGAAMAFAGVAHLTFARKGFQAQVPRWVAVDADRVVVWSGWAEVGIGAALLTVWRQPHRVRLGRALALFYVAIFPGNVFQYLDRRDGLGLDTDAKRLARLPFQALLVWWALAATRDAAR